LEASTIRRCSDDFDDVDVRILPERRTGRQSASYLRSENFELIILAVLDLQSHRESVFRMKEMKRVTLRSSVAICKDVVFRELQGEAIILNLNTGVYFGLNEVGSRMWTLIQQHASLARVFDAIQEEYEVTPEILEADLLNLVSNLQNKGLVSVSEEETPKVDQI
jgi:Coenzyme PQQ synthesis protein D (PqqD)